MAKTRQVLSFLSVEQAKRRRICHHARKKHSIASGELCLVVRDPASGGKKNYCQECGNAILDVAADDVESLRHELNS